MLPNVGITLLNRPISDSIIISPTTAPFIQGCVQLNLDHLRSSVYQPTNRKKKHLYTADCNITRKHPASPTPLLYPTIGLTLNAIRKIMSHPR